MQPDTRGNKLIVTKVGNRGLQVGLWLEENRVLLTLGHINLAARMFQTVRKKKKHLLKKANAYGICYFLLANATTFEKVELRDEENTWLIPVKDILEKGFYLEFSKEGYEKQIFVTLQQLEEYKVKNQLRV